MDLVELVEELKGHRDELRKKYRTLSGTPKHDELLDFDADGGGLVGQPMTVGGGNALFLTEEDDLFPVEREKPLSVEELDRLYGE